MIKSDYLQKSIRAMRYLFYKDLSISDQQYIHQILDEKLVKLFWKLKKEDRAHSLEVLSRMKTLSNDHKLHELALLHDIGKVCSDIGWLGRIFADLGLNRSLNAKYYKKHEKLGLQLLRDLSNEDEDSDTIYNYNKNLIENRHELLERTDY